MINRIQLIRNIGLYDSVNGAANIPLSRLTLIYAENGRGKTTLAAILRSLGTNDPLPIAERGRLGATNSPHVVLDCDGGPQPAVFQNNTWNRALDNVVVFDDLFVDQNVYSGLTVSPEHRQNLHELILGAQGVALNKRLQDLVAKVEAHNSHLRAKANAIPPSERGTLSVDDFCALPARADIDTAIQAAERNLAAVRQQEPIRNTPPFDPLALPPLDATAIETILQRDLPALDTTAAERVQAHLASLGPRGEAWVADGMSRMRAPAGGTEAAPCPFCAQGLSQSPLISHYRAYFSAAYSELKQAVADALGAHERTHAGDVPASFERAVRVAGERRQFWSAFCEIPEITVDTAAIARDWRAARDSVSAALAAKQSAPLDRASLPPEARTRIAAYEAHRAGIATLNARLQQANASTQIVKQQAGAGNPAAIAADIARLKATKSRHTPATSALCQAYLDEKAAKALTEAQRDQVRAELDQHRTSAFPACQMAINGYLRKFNAGFHLQDVTHTNTRGGSTCTYNVLINNASVPVAGGTPAPGEPCFRTTLSSGDRNSLALAFFFASLDRDPLLANKIVVIDDPMTSLDEHRSLTTVQEVRGLSQRAQQVIVLSHSKAFLCGIWEHANHQLCTALMVEEAPTGSTVRAWTITDDCVTEYDRRHAGLREFQQGVVTRAREVARDLRHVLEGFLRRCCPEHFLPGEVLGKLRERIRNQPAGATPILPPAAVTELDAILEYANKFHHDTNPAWETETVNNNALRGWVDRTLAFVRK
ncbi:MAG: AAA family ATPase [Armatimonadetes bacterium]|nr:AAA family ATPase [Armatimonadota bacterium]